MTSGHFDMKAMHSYFRQLESLTMSYISFRNLSTSYYERMKSNRKKLVLQQKALLIIYTELSDKPGQSTELHNLMKVRASIFEMTPKVSFSERARRRTKI